MLIQQVLFLLHSFRVRSLILNLAYNLHGILHVLCVCPLGSLVSSHLVKTGPWTGYTKLPLGVNEYVNVCVNDL